MIFEQNNKRALKKLLKGAYLWKNSLAQLTVYKHNHGVVCILIKTSQVAK